MHKMRTKHTQCFSVSTQTMRNYATYLADSRKCRTKSIHAPEMIGNPSRQFWPNTGSQVPVVEKQYGCVVILVSYCTTWITQQNANSTLSDNVCTTAKCLAALSRHQYTAFLMRCIVQETHQEIRQRTWTFFTTTSYTYYKRQ